MCSAKLLNSLVFECGGVKDVNKYAMPHCSEISSSHVIISYTCTPLYLVNTITYLRPTSYTIDKIGLVIMTGKPVHLTGNAQAISDFIDRFEVSS